MLSSILIGLIYAILVTVVVMGLALFYVHRFKFQYYPHTIALLVMTRGSPLHWMFGIMCVLCIIASLAF